jgi:GNAT superfamily N-acetyltransferase
MLKIEAVTSKNFEDIPDPCKYCLYWQTSNSFNNAIVKQEIKKKKREWFEKVVKTFGNCMKIVYLSNVSIGFIQYAPPKFFPRIEEYASGPSSEDAVFLACLYITNRKARGKGFGTHMLEDVITELGEKGHKAVETFARKDSSNNPSGPLKFYLKNGFKIEREKDDYPLVRLEFYTRSKLKS